MTKKPWGIFLALSLLLGAGISWAAGQLEITAPGGGEMDLQQNIMKYYGLGSQLVEVSWDDLLLETKYLEYDQKQEILKGKEQVELTQKAKIPRVLKASELVVNRNQDYIVASKGVVLKYDEITSATGNSLEWDRGINLIKLTDQAMIIYKDWTIKGSRIEGQLDKGIFTVYGPVEAFNKLNTIRGGKLIFYRGMEKVEVEDNPLLIRGKNEIAASKIVYLINTNQVLASGMVKTRIIDETK
jgi:lipopolysaccharide export system protein LptA